MKLSVQLWKLTLTTEFLYHVQGHSALVLQMMKQQSNLSVCDTIPNQGMHPIPVVMLTWIVRTVERYIATQTFWLNVITCVSDK